MGVGHIALAIPVLAAVIAARLPVRDNSYLWHVRAGTLQIDNGSVITTDPFSFTAFGQAWRTQSWLMDLLYGWGDRIVGLGLVTPLVVTGSALMVAAIGLRVFRAVGKPLPAAVGVAWIMWLVIGYFTPRPVLFSLALLAGFLLIADERRLRWTIPMAMWLWAAVHGGFIVGLGYLVLDGLRRRDRSRLVDVLAATAVTLFTAHGWGTWQVVLEFLGNSRSLDLIMEWLTPNFISVEHFPFAIGIVALLIGAIRRRIEMRDLWVIGPFLLFAFTANRSVPIAGLVLAPFFVAGLGSWRAGGVQATKVQSALNVAILGLLVVVAWLAPLKGGLDQSLFGIEALGHAQPGPLFHDDGVGGYLIYAEWPARRVFVDDRAELYRDTFGEFVRARGGDAVWREVFDRYDLHQALLKVGDPLGQVLEAAGWVVAYRDEGFVLYLDEPFALEPEA